MIQLSATRYSCIAILWASLVSFAAITICVALNECLLLFFLFSYQLSPESFGYTLVHQKLANFWFDEFNVVLCPCYNDSTVFSHNHHTSSSSVQTGSGAHPASYPIRTDDSFPGNKTDQSPPPYLLTYLLTSPLRSHWNIGPQLYNCWGFYSS
jgi:hypothetical protein